MIVVVPHHAVVLLAVEAAKPAIDPVHARRHAHDAMPVEAETAMGFDEPEDWSITVVAGWSNALVTRPDHGRLPGVSGSRARSSVFSTFPAALSGSGSV